MENREFTRLTPNYRRPAVVGRFYPAEPDKLTRSIREFLEPPQERIHAIGTSDLQRLEELGHAIAKVVRDIKSAALIIASSDMNHYESDAITRVKDRKAIDQVLAMDPEGLYDVVHREKISMCGYGPAVAMLTAAKQLGATKAELVRYATSG